MRKLFTLLLAVAASIGTMFASTKIGDLYYNLDATNQTAEVASNSSASGDIIIPSSVTYNSVSYSVTSIGNYAFSGCSGLTSVTIGNSVTSIGVSAFYNCSGLTSVTLGNSVTSIGELAFSGCRGLTSPVYNAHVFAYMPTSYSGAYTIPDGIKSIGGRAFYNCSGLTSVTIPNSVTSIGNYAFYNCSGLTSVTIPNSVTSIGSSAFKSCTGLTSVTIPNSVTSIGDYAFYNCRGLTAPVYNAHVFAYMPTSYSGAYTIPDGIESIAGGAFSYCSSLTSVTIPNSVTSIGSSAFSDCSSLPVIDNIRYADTYLIEAVAKTLYTYSIKEGTRWIGSSAFSYCSSLTSVTIPNSVTSIGSSAFKGCSRLTSVTIPNSVTSIGEEAFKDCSGLTSVTLGNSVTSIGELAFFGCSGLTSVTIPNSVTSIGSSAFKSCTGLTSVTIPNSVTSIGSSAFSECTGLTSINVETNNPNYCSVEGVLFNKDKTRLIQYPGGKQGAYTIPSSVTSIGSSAFKGCTGLISVTIPNSVTSIGDYAFYNCSGLTSVTIPNSVTSIGSSAFYYCTGLTSVTIPNSVTSIGDYAFYNCSGLTAIYVPCGEMERFKQMLNNDSRINDHAPLPYTITINAEHGNVTYPQTMCDDMQLTATPNYGYHFVKWSDGNTDNPRTIWLSQDTTFTAEFAIDKSGTCGKNNLLQWTFADDGTLTISGSGELTENYTFGVEAPTQMQQLVVGNEVTAIGERAFYEKTTLQKLIIGSNVTSIGDYAFSNINNRQLTSLVMPAELLTIGDYAFSGNTYLESIDFNAKLQSIGAYAFKDCYRVSEMTCLATVTPNVGTDALASINSYASLCVPAECLRKYQVDPNWGRFDLCELGTTSTVTENRTVTVEPTDNTAIFTWPTENNAASYSLQITKDGVVFCTLVFNSNGQLTGIAFAPGRNGAAHAPAATMSVAGMSFTVTGLDGASKYAYRLAVTNDASEELVAYSGEFATTGYNGEVNPGGNPEGIEDVFTDEHKASKILRNGQIFILRGEKVYTLTGAEVK